MDTEGKGTRQTTSIDEAIAERIRSARISAGWSQEKLAKALGISFQQVQKYERGSNRISAGRLMQIAEALGMDVAAFFPGGGEALQSIPKFSRSDLEILTRLAALSPKAKTALLTLVNELPNAA